MSRKDELLKLAQLFHSQARLTLDRFAKQVLRKLGDHYQNEATVMKRDDRKHVGKPTLAELQTKLSELSNHNPYGVGGKSRITQCHLFQDCVLLAISRTFGQGGQWGCPFSGWSVFDASYREIDRTVDVSDPSEAQVHAENSLRPKQLRAPVGRRFTSGSG
ncbi:MAG: hypothetical protein WCF86_08365 [Pseudolabrys sp.]